MESYSLRSSEIHTLTEIGKFRVAAVEDIAKHAHACDRSRIDGDLRNLIHQRLAERRDTSVLNKESQQVLTLTKEGKRLIRRHDFVLDDQAIYSGFVKPEEADHDASFKPPVSQGCRRGRTQGRQSDDAFLPIELEERPDSLADRCLLLIQLLVDLFLLEQ